MSTKKNSSDVTLTVMRSGFPVPFDSYSNRICYRGEVVTLTAEQVEGTKDRLGRTWLDLDDGEQIERWGIVRFKLGDHSADVGFIGDDDSTVRFRRRENAIIAANAISDPQDRAEAHREVKRLYGAAQGSQRTLRSFEA